MTHPQEAEGRAGRGSAFGNDSGFPVCFLSWGLWDLGSFVCIGAFQASICFALASFTLFLPRASLHLRGGLRGGCCFMGGGAEARPWGELSFTVVCKKKDTGRG